MMSFDTAFCIAMFVAYYIIAWSYLSECDKYNNSDEDED